MIVKSPIAGRLEAALVAAAVDEAAVELDAAALPAVWAVEHEIQLSAENWTEVENVAPGANLEAVLFLLDLRPAVAPHLQELRDRLHDIWSEEEEEGADDAE